MVGTQLLPNRGQGQSLRAFVFLQGIGAQTEHFSLLSALFTPP
jgi:hypothetical protein